MIMHLPRQACHWLHVCVPDLLRALVALELYSTDRCGLGQALSREELESLQAMLWPDESPEAAAQPRASAMETLRALGVRCLDVEEGAVHDVRKTHGAWPRAWPEHDSEAEPGP